MLNPEPIDADEYRGQSFDRIIERLIGEVNDLKEAISMDEQLRRNNPALQDAYEQYQTIKGLTNG